MKKKIVVLLSLVMILSMLLCGCGASADQLTFSSGETLTVKEVKKLDNTSGYIDDKVTVELTVKKVDAKWGQLKSKDGIVLDYDTIAIDASMSRTNTEVIEVIETLSQGDRIRVTGTLSNSGIFGVTVDEITSIEIIQ